MSKVYLYTDGACSGNPGVGGYAFVAIEESTGNTIIFVNGGNKYTTNNCMELTAIVRGLKHLLSPDIKFYVNNGQSNRMAHEVIVRSDSAYCVNAVTQGWIEFWKNNDWKTKQGGNVKNKELWIELLSLLKNKRLSITFEKVKGHSGDKYNEMVDQAAKDAIKRLKDKSLSKQKAVHDELN